MPYFNILINTILVFNIIYNKAKFNYINLIIIYLNFKFSNNIFFLNLKTPNYN